jgi:hypothetical protein
MRKLLNRKIREQAGICAICHEDFTDCNDIVPDHKEPKGFEKRHGAMIPERQSLAGFRQAKSAIIHLVPGIFCHGHDKCLGHDY